jgi:hypothetical protein
MGGLVDLIQPYPLPITFSGYRFNSCVKNKLRYIGRDRQVHVLGGSKAGSNCPSFNSFQIVMMRLLSALVSFSVCLLHFSLCSPPVRPVSATRTAGFCDQVLKVRA